MPPRKTKAMKTVPETVKPSLREDLATIRAEKELAIKDERFEAAAQLRQTEIELLRLVEQEAYDAAAPKVAQLPAADVEVADRLEVRIAETLAEPPSMPRYELPSPPMREDQRLWTPVLGERVIGGGPSAGGNENIGKIVRLYDGKLWHRTHVGGIACVSEESCGWAEVLTRQGGKEITWKAPLRWLALNDGGETFARTADAWAVLNSGGELLGYRLPQEQAKIGAPS